MSLTKAWWMMNFVHLHGTSLKSDPRVGSKDLKGKVKRGQWNEHGSKRDPRRGLVTVYQGT
eukprot:10539730-Prorocentrum_lima.AAC.1